jgi:hypothetical protein
MFVDRFKGPPCQKCGETMALRIIEPERPGFDSRTFECPKCFVTETLVVSISRSRCLYRAISGVNGNTAVSIANTASRFSSNMCQRA